MIEHRIGNIFEQPDINIVLQQCNLFHTFGAGIAKTIKELFPYAYEADLKTPKGDERKLSTFSVGKPDGTPSNKQPVIVNLYSQSGIGGSERQTRYDSLDEGMRKLEKKLAPVADKYVLGIPYTISCGLANGNWLVVSAIIKSVFDKSPLKVIICRLPSQQEFPSVFDSENEKTAMVKAVSEDHGTFVLTDEVF